MTEGSLRASWSGPFCQGSSCVPALLYPLQRSAIVQPIRDVSCHAHQHRGEKIPLRCGALTQWLSMWLREWPNRVRRLEAAMGYYA